MSKMQQSAYVETVNDPAMLKHLDFYGGVAQIRVAAIDLFAMPFEIEKFVEDADYWAEVDRVRQRGHDNSKPISLHQDETGRWIVDEDDVDRFAAAKKVAGEIFANLLSTKVRFVRFELHTMSSEDSVYVWDAEPQTRRPA